MNIAFSQEHNNYKTILYLKKNVRIECQKIVYLEDALSLLTKAFLCNEGRDGGRMDFYHFRFDDEPEWNDFEKIAVIKHVKHPEILTKKIAYLFIPFT